MIRPGKRIIGRIEETLRMGEFLGQVKNVRKTWK
jgi:hypothetical protein